MALVHKLGCLAIGFALSCGGTPELVVDNGHADGGTGEGAGGAGGSNDSGRGIINTGDAAPPDDASLPLPVCGNGVLETKELCDDGNTIDGDGCSGDCTKQNPDYDCSESGKPCKNLVVCGNSKIEGDEACDDGNKTASDGCSADCKAVDNGYVCPRPGTACVKLSVCGNGARERGEQCDDGKTPPTDGDGCSATCQLEPGFFCPTPGQACIARRCGDGMLTPDEDCDDGQSPPKDGDGCSGTCKKEVGWSCPSTGACVPQCGDGKVVSSEECDDGNVKSGDGCSAACKKEPFYACSGQPSNCSSTITCGNSMVEPGEKCDPPGVGGCLPGCKSFSPTVGGGVCGNSIIEAGEACDPPAAGSGCTAGCLVEPGWSCPRPGACVKTPTCGDGIVNVALGEQCDDGNANGGDGCADCRVTQGWFCSGLQPSVCVHEVCGDGVRTPTELCDDGNPIAGDGCTGCQIDVGWVCPSPGKPCVPRCGDGQTVGSEQCDDNNVKNLDGCNASCRVEPGFACPKTGACTPAACGNGKTEGGEGCDDSNQIAGDGCGPTCQLEPAITPATAPDKFPIVQVTCGDGLKTGTEECDDGNTTAGDGCSSACKKELGFLCSESLILPSSVEMQVTVRDFRAGNATAGHGHPDFQYAPLDLFHGVTGVACTSGNTNTCGRLDAEGKPTFALGAGNNRNVTGIRDTDTFSLWYRSTNATVMGDGNEGLIQILPFKKTLVLSQTAPGSSTYTYDSNGAFFPLGPAEGFGNLGNEVAHCNGGVLNLGGGVFCPGNCCVCDGACMGRNFSFTTELRYFFQYQGGETLVFTGDDDVWVFVNGRLAVDMGGMHQALNGRVVLGDDGAPAGTDSDCSAHGVGTLAAVGTCLTAAENDNTDARFGLTKNQVYEIVLVHAERHSFASNFRLTLSGFLAPRSYCTPQCGDGRIVSGEVCDDGPNNKDGVSGACNTTCTALAYCGDGVVQTGEACDNGKNTDLYLTGSSAPTACAPGCIVVPRCGDHVVQPGYEDCDNGANNNDASYGPSSCTTKCQLGGFCGDGIVNGAERCDAGKDNGGYGAGSCGYDCKAGPYCGDGVRNGPEECDGSAHCDASCRLTPYCGDGVTSQGEECDWGQFASSAYGACTDACKLGPRCGDGVLQTPYEECDAGQAANQANAYGGCSPTCTKGPRCGDGVVQASEGEACDNGVNEDTYAFTSNACGRGCKAVPSCGDGIVDPAHELCDNGKDNSDAAYNGCTTSCEWGPYCGDGKVNGAETCDDGSKNRAYSPQPGGCGYDCRPAPYCGDGERNGTEQCDLGTTNNTGAYGGCNASCTRAPYCGDRVLQTTEGEQCDDGAIGSLACTTDCKTRDNVR